jgi:acyl CoA:acetate/3-ketoacid CoA transferase
MATRSKIISIDEIGSLIADGAVVTVSSSSGLGCPDASLRAIGKHFLEKATCTAFRESIIWRIPAC